MNKIKAVRYYLFRYLKWEFLLSSACLLARECLYIFTKVSLQHFSNLVVYLTYLDFVWLPLDILAGIIIVKMCLNKVFFKPYKYITITPKFQSVSFGFATKTLLKITGITLLILLISLIMLWIFGHLITLSTKNSEESLKPLIFFVTLIAIPVSLFIIKRVIKRNAGQKVNIWFMAKTLLKIMGIMLLILLILLIISWILDLSLSKNSGKFEVMLNYFLTLLITIPADLFIINRTVRKSSIIESKNTNL